MARDFSKNTSNKVSLGVGTLGPLLNGASALSMHVWANFDSLTTGSTDNRIFGALFGANLTMFTAYVDGSVTPKLFTVGARALSSDTFANRSNKTPILLNTWYSLGGVVDFERGKIFTYVNGQRGANAAWSATFGATSATDNATGRTSADGLGANDATSPTTAIQVDGRLAELTIWKTRLSDTDFARLAAGRPTHLIKKGGQIARWTLSDAGIIDIINGKNGTITGSVPIVPYEPFRYVSIRPYIPFFDAATAPAGTGAATLPAITSSGSGIASHPATGTPTLPKIIASGTGVSARTSTGSVTLPRITVSGSGISAHTSTGSVTLGAITVSGSGVKTSSGSEIGMGDVALPHITVDGTGSANGIRAGTGACSLPAMTASGTGSSSNVRAAAGRRTLAYIIGRTHLHIPGRTIRRIEN